MDNPAVPAVGSWLDNFSRAFTHLEQRVSAIELVAPARSSELRDQISKLARRIGAIEERLGLLDEPEPPANG